MAVLCPASFKINSTDTATQTYNITVSGFGTPVAALFYYGACDDDGTINGSARYGHGMTDGSTELAFASTDGDARTTTGLGRRSINNGVISMITINGGTEIGRASFTSWITDGVRVTLDLAPSINISVFVVLVGGGAAADVTEFSLGNNTSAKSITGLSYEPDIAIAFGHCAEIPSSVANFNTSVHGFAVNNASIEQAAYSTAADDNVSTSETATTLSDDHISMQTTDVGVTTSYVVPMTSFNSDGLTMTPSVAAANDELMVLTISLPSGTEATVEPVTIPTSGNYSLSGASVDPDFVLMFLAQGPSTGAANTTSGVAVTLCAFDASEIHSVSYSSEDNVTTTVCKVVKDNVFVGLEEGGTKDMEASGYSLDDDGFTLTLSNNPTAAVNGYALLVGPAAAVSGPLNNNRISSMHFQKPWEPTAMGQ